MEPISFGVPGVEATSAVAMGTRGGIELDPVCVEVRRPGVDILGRAHQKSDVVEPRFRVSVWAGVKGEVVLAMRQVKLVRARPPLHSVSQNIAVESLHDAEVVASKRNVPDSARRRSFVHSPNIARSS